ncbi:uncharacterized protein BYT42DRAFT_489789 [Radiomyces spectabilis]|uniref:uncharacterized protein n=1 Tax=Radiomyces spectabilis TaxID=64574 RepID=UPI00221E8EF0|nr:uncharacterized protein BYT42DRAFT_489789 [Radiomyces spectabilis]KAI8391609.1 hypothetical protein BYT42DRAFT_489789 [Radiomyces spectabilis]
MLSTIISKTCSQQQAPVAVHTCNGRGKSYCLIHRRYFETSWCPDCGRSSRKWLFILGPWRRNRLLSIFH